MHRRARLNVEWCCKAVNALSSRRPLLSTLRHELVGNYETLSYAKRRSRLSANHSPTRLQSLRGQRNARPAALITRAYSQAGKFKDFGGPEVAWSSWIKFENDCNDVEWNVRSAA